MQRDATQHVTDMAGACPKSTPGVTYGQPWFAVRVREKFRRVTEEILTARDIEYFSPQTSEIRQWTDRRKVVHVPLFAGYMFCRFDPQQQVQVIVRTLGVIDIVRRGATLSEVDPTELEAVRIAVGAVAVVEEVAQLVTGQRVRVCKGPMRDVEGVLVEQKNKCKLLLAVTMMNRSVAVEIDRADVIALG